MKPGSYRGTVKEVSPFIERVLRAVADGKNRNGRLRPFVTLSYAQSLDGSIAIHPENSVRLSSPEAERFTHHLRAAHEAILIGVGTLLADDPLLTVRLVSGTSPRPVVVDSRLRFPLCARLLRDEARLPLIATTDAADCLRESALQEKNVELVHLPACEHGWVDLPSLLAELRRRGMRSLMVEGGARIISSFLKAGLADQLVLTITPYMLGGYCGVEIPGYDFNPGLDWLANAEFWPAGTELLIRGDFS